MKEILIPMINTFSSFVLPNIDGVDLMQIKKSSEIGCGESGKFQTSLCLFISG